MPDEIVEGEREQPRSVYQGGDVRSDGGRSFRTASSLSRRVIDLATHDINVLAIAWGLFPK